MGVLLGLLTVLPLLGERWLPWLLARNLPPADRVRVHKSRRRLYLFRRGQVLAVYPVTLGPHPVGTKAQEGDGRTPEGHYLLDWRNPHSRFFLSLHITYPGPGERRAAVARGVSPGGAIMLHGRPNGLAWLYAWRRDWTAGCIAVSNTAMVEIWRAVADGTPIEIKP